MSPAKLAQIQSVLTNALSEELVNEIGLETGQSKRLRVITPHRLFCTIVAALAGGIVDSIADLLRDFNYRTGTQTAYKAFYNRLAQAGFAAFTYAMLERLLGELALKTLRPDTGSPLAAFKDVIIQDGSSFALKRSLKAVFPGRFTTAEPAAVELHATYSGLEDNPVSIVLAPDKEAERQFLPSPEELRGKLLLADRGYPDRSYFEQLIDAGAFFIVRLSRSYDPYVLAAYTGRRRRTLPRGVRLAQFIAQNQSSPHDLDVEFRRGPRGSQSLRVRCLLLPSKEKAMTRLATNLGRARFPAKLVARLYRFRWQVELCFKEWKSYANLHRFDTANEHIAEGLIWASLCAAILERFLAHATQVIFNGRPISTRRVAMCAARRVDRIFDALLLGRGLHQALRDAIAFLADNAQRAHPKRDRERGRLQAGLRLERGARWCPA